MNLKGQGHSLCPHDFLYAPQVEGKYTGLNVAVVFLFCRNLSQQAL